MKVSKDSGYKFICTLSSGDDEYPECILRVGIGKYVVSFELPHIIKPDVLKVRGQYNYDEKIERRYGFYLFENHFNVVYGRGDANFHRNEFGEEQRWSCFLPWVEWQHVRHSLYGLQGEHLYSQFDKLKMPNRYDKMREVEATIPKAVFRFYDFDNEEIEATTHIEEREWHRGVGYFKWLRFFYKPMIRRNLSISFNKETGRKKGSWKGGTIGTSIEITECENHVVAFKQYCQKNNMTFIN